MSDPQRPLRYLGLIPARGGSKRLPRKNLLDFGGLPLVGRAIVRARAAGCLDTVAVSTEDAAIAAVALKYGATLVRRPESLAGDRDSVLDAARHALADLEATRPPYDAVVLLQPSSPFRTARHIKESVRLYEQAGGDTLAAVQPAREHPYYHLVIEQGLLTPLLGWDKLAAPRQDLPATYVENGVLWIFDAAVLRRGGGYGRRLLAYPMDPADGVDIDTEDDLRYARYLLAQREDHETVDHLPHR